MIRLMPVFNSTKLCNPVEAGLGWEEAMVPRQPTRDLVLRVLFSTHQMNYGSVLDLITPAPQSQLVGCPQPLFYRLRYLAY